MITRTDRIIVCGSRYWNDRLLLNETLARIIDHKRRANGFAPITLVQGGARGADKMALEFAVEFGNTWDLKVETFAPRGTATRDYHERNQAMVDAGADLCVGFTDGRNQSGTWGTGDTFSRALKVGIPIRGYPSRR